MDKNKITKALQTLKKDSKKRKFVQSVDLVLKLQDINLKNTDEQLDFFVNLHYTVGKKKSVCAFVGPELNDNAKEVCDEVIKVEDFPAFQDKKKAKKLAKKHDFFVAQANIMPKVATTFGRSLGPRGKMPNPKAGGIVPGNANLKPLYDRIQKMIRIVAKKDPIIQVLVGREDMKDEELIDNIHTIYNQVIHHLPKEENNVKSVLLKLTMSKPVVI